MLKRKWNFLTNAESNLLITGGQILAKKRFTTAKMASLSSTVQMKEIICSDFRRHIRNIYLVLI